MPSTQLNPAQPRGWMPFLYLLHNTTYSTEYYVCTYVVVQHVLYRTEPRVEAASGQEVRQKMRARVAGDPCQGARDVHGETRAGWSYAPPVVCPRSSRTAAPGLVWWSAPFSAGYICMRRSGYFPHRREEDFCKPAMLLSRSIVQEVTGDWALGVLKPATRFLEEGVACFICIRRTK